MKKNRVKEDNEKFSVQKQIRYSKTMEEFIRAKALEHHTTDSEIIRQAIMAYVNRSMSDSEIVHASIAENTRKIRYLENKVELLALIVFEQTKQMMRVLPNKQINADYMVEKDFDKFKANVTNLLKKNHAGVLEGMILDAYEQIGDEA